MDDSKDNLMNAASDFMFDAKKLTAMIRVARLQRLNILTTDDPVLDDIVAKTAEECGFPTALLTFIMDDYAFVKSSHNGIPVGREPHEVAFCNTAIENPCQPLIVQDANKDSRFCNNPKVTSGALTTYAGMPITCHDGVALGALCVVDPIKRQMSEAQIETLKSFAQTIAKLLDQ